MGARLILGVALALSACGAASRPMPPDAVILPGSAVAEILHQCSRRAPATGEATWMPDTEDIIVLEAALPAAVRGRSEIVGPHNFGDDLDWARVPHGWRRQYVGIVRGDHRFIYGNLFPSEPSDPFTERLWETSPIVICDGGPAIFGVEYDVEAGRFTQIAFNVSLG